MTVQLALTGHDKDLGGGFRVRRLLPSAKRQSIGPFLFFDHFGPVTEQPGSNHDVRPHPHIGLATVTYLFEGAMMHRDSVGSVQRIEPGAINWMTAGRGIVHSERRPDDLRQTAYVNHGLQLWAALPRAHEEAEPSFTHTPAAAIPELAVGDAQVRVLIGQAFGRASPVATFAPTLYLDVKLAAGGTLELPPLAQEMALYPVDGELRVDGEPVADRTLALLAPGAVARIEAPAATRLVVIGGDPLDGHRFMWWNFVSSRKERIVQASQDWSARTMGQVPGETEFIPLPEHAFNAG
jgi:redox-sensitive bicupin YhaK (pirin superfamily)